MKLGITSPVAARYRLSRDDQARLTFDQRRVVEALVQWGRASTVVALQRVSYAKAFGWSVRRVGRVLGELRGLGVLGPTVRTPRRRKFAMPPIAELERRISKLPAAPPASADEIDRACRFVSAELGPRKACLLRHIATAIGGVWRGGQRGLIEALARMGHRASERTVRTDLAELLSLGAVESRGRQRTKAYSANCRFSSLQAAGSPDHRGGRSARDTIKERSPSLDLGSSDSPSHSSSEITNQDPQGITREDSMPVEQRPLFAGPEDRVWGTFLDERARCLRRVLKPDQAERRLARLPKLTSDRRRALGVFVATHGEESSRLIVIGLWSRESKHDGAIERTTIERLWAADTGWLEQLENHGDDELARRQARAEQEQQRKAAVGAQIAADQTPEARDRAAVLVEDARRARAEIEAERARNVVVPLRRAGGR